MRPAKICKWTLIVLSALVVLIITALLLFITLVPAERFSSEVASRAEAALGRKVTIGGIRWGLRGLTLSDMAIYDGADDKAPLIAGVRRVDLAISPLSLLSLSIDVSSVTLTRAVINISFDEKGKSNIQKLISSISERGTSGLSATISRLVLKDVTITLSSPPPILDPLAGTYRVDAAIVFGDDIAIRNGAVILPENRGRLFPELVVHTKEKELRITGSVNLENASLLWVYRWGTNVTLPYHLINGTVKNLTITKNFVTGDVKATSTLRNTAKVLSADGFCRVDITGRTVFIGKAQGKVDSSTFYVDALHFTFDGDLIRFNVNNVDAAIVDVAPLLSFLPRKLYGRMKGNLSHEKGLYNGTVTLIKCGYDSTSGMVSGLDAVITVKDNIFKQTEIPFLFYGNQCKLSIASTEPSLKKLFINITGDQMTIDPSKHEYVPQGGSVNLPIQITGIANINALSYEKIRLSRVQLQYLFTGNEFVIQGFQFFYCGGKVSGSGSIIIGEGAPRASLSMHAQGLLVHEALAHSEKWRNRFFGQLEGDAKINFSISKEIFKTARGNVEFNINKGKLVDTGIQNGLGLLLAELKYKLRDLEFDRIYGNINIAGTDFQVNSFIFNATDLRLKITGLFDQNLIAKPLHINLEFTRRFIQDLPGAVTLGLNKYQIGDWYIMPFIQNGDITNSKNLRRAD